MTRPEQIKELATEIIRSLNGRPFADGLLALLLAVEYALEQLLQKNPPPNVEAVMEGLYNHVREFTVTGQWYADNSKQ